MTEKELNELQIFIDNLNEYLEDEFEIDEDEAYTIEKALEKNEIGVYCTTSFFDECGLKDEAVTYQISYFLDDKTLKFFFDGFCVSVERFKSYEEMADDIGDFLYRAEKILEYEVIDGILKVDECGYIDWDNSLYLPYNSKCV